MEKETTITEQKRKALIEFHALPIFERAPMYYVLDDENPILGEANFTKNDELVIYLKKVSHYMEMIAETRRIDKHIDRIINAFYEEDLGRNEAVNSDDMHALAAACYYLQRDFDDETQYSSKHNKKYGYVIKPLIRKMTTPNKRRG